MLKIEYLDEEIPVYDITVEDNHNFFANQILVHNCLEILLTTKPLKYLEDPEGEIALCILSAFNLGLINELSDVELWADLIVRALDELIDYQEYLLPAAANATINRRSLGIGVINYAYYLAKNGTSYSDEKSHRLTHELFEAISYYLIKASMNVAKEKGACSKFNETKYSHGIFPIDTYKRDVDEICDNTLNLDWEQLKKDVQTYGMRNSTLMALMPSECQSLSNLLKLKDGSEISLYQFIKDNTDLDIEEIHKTCFPGQRFQLTKPVELASETEVSEIYWNGYQSMTEIEFEDGSKYRFTPNHKLLINNNGLSMWKEVQHITENDDNIKKIIRDISVEPTWDISTNTETYVLANGCVSHNTSSQLANATNGIEPPRGLVSQKGSKDSQASQVVPKIHKLKNKYQLAWDMPNNDGYIKNVAVMQKFVDQAISGNLYYDPKKFTDGKIPASVLLKDFLTCYKYGWKTYYYQNTNDGRDEEDEGCVGGACKI